MAGAFHTYDGASSHITTALMLRRCASTVSKHEGVSRDHWNILRDAALRLLLRMRIGV
jgi:hypothetical protein